MRGIVTCCCNICLEMGGKVRKSIHGNEMVGQLVRKIRFDCKVEHNRSVIRDKSLREEIADDPGTLEMALICG